MRVTEENVVSKSTNSNFLDLSCWCYCDFFRHSIPGCHFTFCFGNEERIKSLNCQKSPLKLNWVMLKVAVMQARQHKRKDEWIDLLKNENDSSKDICVMVECVCACVLDVSGTKCAEVLFLGSGLCRHGVHMFDRCFGSAASHPSTPPPPPPHSLTRLSCWRSPKVMYCLRAVVNLARPLQPIRHVKLNHCRILISLWEQRPRCCRGNGRRAVHCMVARLSCYLSVWWFYREGGCHCAAGIVRKEGQQAGIKAGYRLGRHSVRQVVNLWVS